MDEYQLTYAGYNSLYFSREGISAITMPYYHDIARHLRMDSNSAVHLLCWYASRPNITLPSNRVRELLLFEDTFSQA